MDDVKGSMQMCELLYRSHWLSLTGLIEVEQTVGRVHSLMVNVTVPQHAGGPDFLPIYVSSSFKYLIIFELNGSKTFITTQCTISNHSL